MEISRERAATSPQLLDQAYTKSKEAFRLSASCSTHIWIVLKVTVGIRTRLISIVSLTTFILKQCTHLPPAFPFLQSAATLSIPCIKPGDWDVYGNHSYSVATLKTPCRGACFHDSELEAVNHKFQSRCSKVSIVYPFCSKHSSKLFQSLNSLTDPGQSFSLKKSDTSKPGLHRSPSTEYQESIWMHLIIENSSVTDILRRCPRLYR